MSLNIKRIQLTENGVTQDVDILTSADSVTFEDGVNLQDKYDNGDIASADVLGDITDVVGTLNELGASAREATELIGEMANRGGLTSALRKEVASGEWENVSTLPYDFNNGSIVVLDNEIHILSSNNSTYELCHYKWNGSTWESVSTLPYKCARRQSVVLNNEIHILGSDNSTYEKSHYKWNGSSWKSVSTLPQSTYGSSIVILNNEIHILGGYNDYTKNHYKWNGSTWSSVSTLSYDFSRGGAVVYRNEIHILGTSYTDYYRNHYKWNGSSWEFVSQMYTFNDGSVVVYNNEIHAMGSYESSYRAHHQKYGGGSTWDNVSTLPYSFINGKAVVCSNQIHILGGSGNTIGHYKYKLGTYLNGYSKADTEIYLPISTTPCTSNLVATDNGYTVTEDGYVEVLLNE